MRKEVSIVALLLAAVLLFVYLFNLQFTGFAVFQQATQSDFDEGTYNSVVYDTNASAVVLDVNETSGTYTSKVFDSGDTNTTWNNVEVTGQGDLTFEARVCDDDACLNDTFGSVDISDLGLVGQYFQYRVLFAANPNVTTSLEEVSVDYSVPETVVASVTISYPESGEEYSSDNAVPLEFTSTGTNTTCYYTIDGGTTNNTLTGCDSYSGEVDFGEGDYTLTLYIISGEGEASDSVDFSVVAPEENEDSGGESETTTVPEEQIQSTRAEFSDSSISDVSLEAGTSQDVKWTVTNTGTAPALSCGVTTSGDAASWISGSDEAVDLATGVSNEFTFTVSVPEDVQEGTYSLSVSLTCLGGVSSSSRSLSVGVTVEKLGFQIIDAQRTRDDRVRVIYSFSELTGEPQDVEVTFALINGDDEEIASAIESISLEANSVDEEFATNIEIDEAQLPVDEETNEPVETDLTLAVNFNSQVYSSSVLEPITLGAPTGAAILGGLGTGGVVVIIVVALALVVTLFVVRRMRRSGKPFMTLFKSSPNSE